MCAEASTAHCPTRLVKVVKPPPLQRHQAYYQQSLRCVYVTRPILVARTGRGLQMGGNTTTN
eukprot:871112-Pyramimonas_sp.AAC.2